MNRVRPTLLTLVAIAASVRRSHRSGSGGVLHDDSPDEDVTLATGDPLRGQPKVTKQLPGVCKVLGR